MMMNTVTVAGYVGKTPELRFLPKGTPVTTFRLGHTYSYPTPDGQQAEKTNWFTVVCYGPVAQIAKLFQTGDNVVVDGQLEQREWQGRDGGKRTVYEVIGRNVGKLVKTTSGEANGQPTEGDSHDADWPTVAPGAQS